MTEFTEYAPGTFCWIELTTTDGAAAKEFYTELFGWSIRDVPIGEGQVYTMLEIDGKEVAALYEMGEEQRSHGIPPHWVSYVSVASVDETMEKAQSLGGTVLMGPMDVFEEGRMAMFQDPTGAAFAVWEAGDHIGVRLANEPGTLAWNELATRDVETAKAFYTQLFGWGAETAEMDSGPYTSFMNEDRAAGGMMAMTEEWGDIPPHWMVYFAVADCNAGVEKAESLGAEIAVPPTDIEGVGRFAVLQDPQGAVFSIITLDNPPD